MEGQLRFAQSGERGCCLLRAQPLELGHGRAVFDEVLRTGVYGRLQRRARGLSSPQQQVPLPGIELRFALLIGIACGGADRLQRPLPEKQFDHRMGPALRAQPAGPLGQHILCILAAGTRASEIEQQQRVSIRLSLGDVCEISRRLRKIAQIEVHQAAACVDGQVRDLKFDLPSTHVKRFVVSRELVDNPQAQLKVLLAEQAREERGISRQLIQEFANRFRDSFALTLKFSDAAMEKLIDLAAAQNIPVRDLCATRFKDYQFGLKLISQNTDQQEFTIDVEAVDAPDKVLSDWVVASYRK